MYSHQAFIPSFSLPFNPAARFHRTKPLATRRPRKRPRTRAAAIPDAGSDDEIPASIRALDILELQRRENLSPPQNHLDPAAKEALFRDFPALSRLESDLAKAMAQPDYDPSDHRVYSWAYRYLRPWAPSRLLQITLSALIAYTVTRLVSIIRKRFAPATIASTLVFADKCATLAFAAAIPCVLLAWAFVSARSKRAKTNDALRRCTLMFTATAPVLAAAWMISASGNLALGLASGVLVRLHLAASLWLWGDLRREIFLSSAPVAPFFRVWRFLTTTSVILTGCAIRLLPLLAPRELPLRGEFLLRANRLRVSLASRFPVALSLCSDTRGLFLLGSIVCIALVLHGFYLFIFATDFFRNIYHRRCLTPVTRMMINSGLYQPNVHPDEVSGALSGADTHDSFLPSAPMLLRRDAALATEGMLADEGIMPVIAYLDKEEELLRRDGLTTWLKPRTEQVPITKDLSREKRSLDALYSWSRPLEKEDADKSFVDFFETLEDDEYVYDPVTGNWVFENAGTLGDHAFGGDHTQGDRGDEVATATGQGLERDEGVLQLQTDDDSVLLEVSSELEPWLRKFIEEEGRKDDDADDPSIPVYV